MSSLELISKYWQIILATIGLLATWVRMQGIDKDHEKRITTLETDVKAINPVLLQIQLDIAEIKTTLKIHFKE